MYLAVEASESMFSTKTWDQAKDKVKEIQRFETVKKEKERQEKLCEDILQLKEKYNEKEGLIKC